MIYFLKQNHFYAGNVRLWGYYDPPKWEWSPLQARKNDLRRSGGRTQPGGGVGHFLLLEKNMAVHKSPELKLYVNVKVKGWLMECISV